VINDISIHSSCCDWGYIYLQQLLWLRIHLFTAIAVSLWLRIHLFIAIAVIEDISIHSSCYNWGCIYLQLLLWLRIYLFTAVAVIKDISIHTYIAIGSAWKPKPSPWAQAFSAKLINHMRPPLPHDATVWMYHHDNSNILDMYNWLRSPHVCFEEYHHLSNSSAGVHPTDCHSCTVRVHLTWVPQ
jgi:hypothetical protein